MSYLSLILRIIAILSAIVAGTLYFMSEGTVNDKNQEIARLRSESQKLLDKNETASLEIAELQENLAEETALLEETKAQLEETKAKLIAEMQESQRVQKKFIEAQKEVDQLEETTTRLRKELVNAENLFAAASQESLIAQLKERIKELTAANAQLSNSAETSTSTQGIVSPLKTEPAEPKSNVARASQFAVKKLTATEVGTLKEEAKIASLSIPNGIIVLNTVNSQTLEPGTIVDLVSSAEVVARIEIININGALAIAYIKPGAKLDNLNKGDTVKILR